jgi:hypothetical protein
MKHKKPAQPRSEQDRLLDEALEETFPASDPVSMQQNITVGRGERPPIGDPRRKAADKKS